MMKSLPADADTIDIAEVARNVRRGWPAIIGGVVFGVVMAVAVLWFVPPRFMGSSSILVRAAETGAGSLTARISGSLAGAAGGLLPGGLTSSPIETELQILSSRAIAGEVVDSLLLQLGVHSPRREAPSQLFQGAVFPGSFKHRTLHFEQVAGSSRYLVSGVGAPTEVHPGTPARLAGGTLTLGTQPAPARFDIDVVDREDAVTRVQKHLAVSKAGGEVIGIEYQGDDSLTAAAVPNLIVSRYLARRKTTDRGINQRRVEFLGTQVDSVEGELTAAEQVLRRQQETSGVIDPVVVGKLELERAGDLRQQTGSLDVERGALGQLLAQLGTGQLTSRQLAAFPTFLKSPAINELLAQLSTLETKRLQLLATLTPEDPSVVAVTEGIKNIETQLPSLARAYAVSLDRQRGDVQKQLDTLRSAIEQLPANGEASLRLQRKVLGLGQVSAALRAQLVEAKLSAVGEGGNVQVLDAAEPPRKPSFPQPVPTLAAGGGGGLLLGLLIAIFAGSYGRYVPDARTIERQLGVPALVLDPGIPFLVSGPGDARTLLLVPLDATVDTSGVAERLMRTAASRGLRGTVVDLSRSASGPPSVAPDLDRLGAEFDLVVVRLPELTADSTVGALRETRPVLFVATANRVDRRRLSAALQSLERLSVPCAGVVLSRQNGNALLNG